MRARVFVSLTLSASNRYWHSLASRLLCTRHPNNYLSGRDVCHWRVISTLDISGGRSSFAPKSSASERPATQMIACDLYLGLLPPHRSIITSPLAPRLMQLVYVESKHFCSLLHANHPRCDTYSFLMPTDVITKPWVSTLWRGYKYVCAVAVFISLSQGFIIKQNI